RRRGHGGVRRRGWRRGGLWGLWGRGGLGRCGGVGELPRVPGELVSPARGLCVQRGGPRRARVRRAQLPGRRAGAARLLARLFQRRLGGRGERGRRAGLRGAELPRRLQLSAAACSWRTRRPPWGGSVRRDLTAAFDASDRGRRAIRDGRRLTPDGQEVFTAEGILDGGSNRGQPPG